jgi:predicted MFS family arabinose efflux permease
MAADVTDTGSAMVRPDRRAWLAVLSVAIGTFVLVTTEFLPIGMLTAIAADLGVSKGTAGLMITIPGLVAGFAAPVVMLAAGRLDRRIMLAILSGLLVASNLLSAAAPDFTIMLLGRVLLGFAVGGFWSIAASVGMRLVPEASAARATSLILAGISVGTVLGVPVGALIGEFAGWRTSFAVAGAFAALVLVTQLTFLPRLPTNHAIRLADFADTFRDPVSRLGIIAMVLMFIGQFAAYTYMEPFLKQVTMLEPHFIAALLVSYGLAGLIGNFVGGHVVARDVRLALVGTGAIIASTLVLMPVLGTTPLGAVALVVAWGLGFGSMPVSVQTWMIKSRPEAPEGNLAVMVSVIQFALASGAFVGGSVVDRLGIPSVMYVGGLLMALTVSLVVLNGRSPERRTVPAAAEPCPCQ